MLNQRGVVGCTGTPGLVCGGQLAEQWIRLLSNVLQDDVLFAK